MVKSALLLDVQEHLDNEQTINACRQVYGCLARFISDDKAATVNRGLGLMFSQDEFLQYEAIVTAIMTERSELESEFLSICLDLCRQDREPLQSSGWKLWKKLANKRFRSNDMDGIRDVSAIFDSKKNLTVAELVDSYAIDNRPFTRALLLRAGQDIDIYNAMQTDNIMGRMAEKKVLETLAGNCTKTVAHRITSEAMSSIGRDADFSPSKPIPKDSQAIVAFGLVVVLGLSHQLKAEGLDIDLQSLSLATTNSFFIMHLLLEATNPELQKERIRLITESMEAFQHIVHSDNPKVTEWHNMLMELLSIHILAWTSEKEKFQYRDHRPIFGQMLSGLLACVE
jgi:hypothetical protein